MGIVRRMGWLGALVLLGGTVHAEEATVVTMPADAIALMQSEMQGHLATLSLISGLMAEGKLTEAGNLAEERLGRSSMGKHRNHPNPPGRHMPMEMRAIGWGLHDAGSQFAKAARSGDSSAALSALQGIFNQCVACHAGFKVVTAPSN